MKEQNIDESPFYIEYTGEKVKNIQFKHSESFKKALTKHLKNKFHSDNFGESLRKIVEDYLQHQCLEQKLFQKTIVCIANINQLNQGGAMKVLFIKDNYTQFFQNQLDKGINDGLMFIQVHKSSFYDYRDANLHSQKEWKLIKNELKNYKDLNDVVICEIALNNWLDSYDDGVYGLKSDKNLHLGVNILNTTKDAFGIIYRWGFSNDMQGNQFIRIYGRDVENYDKIDCFDKELILKELYKYNKNQYERFKQMFESYDLDFPKTDYERLQKLYEKKLKEQSKLEDEIGNIKSKLDMLDYFSNDVS